MNLLVYNFFNETSEEINRFLENAHSSVYFAISVTDLVRILEINKIDVAILKFASPNRELLEKLVLISPKTQFYVSSAKVKLIKNEKVHLFPPDVTLNLINKKLKKGA